MALTTEQRRANARKGMDNRERAMAEARAQQMEQPPEAPSGAVLLMRQTREEARAAAPMVPEVDEVMMVNDPVEQTQLLDQGRGTDEQFSSVAARHTSPEATAARKNYVNVVRPPMRQLYHDNGDGVEVFHSDVATLVEEGHMHVRCPKCRYLKPDHERGHLWATDRYGNRVPGVHLTTGENACPGVEPLMWLPCRICGKKVYEDPSAGQPKAGIAGADEFQFELDEKDKATGQTRKQRCEFRRNMHEVSFHEQTALQLYGLRWETFRGRRSTAA